MAWLSTASFNPYSLTGPHVAGGAATSRPSSAYPDWALLRKTARISAFRNATTGALVLAVFCDAKRQFAVNTLAFCRQYPKAMVLLQTRPIF